MTKPNSIRVARTVALTGATLALVAVLVGCGEEPDPEAQAAESAQEWRESSYVTQEYREFNNCTCYLIPGPFEGKLCFPSLSLCDIRVSRECDNRGCWTRRETLGCYHVSCNKGGSTCGDASCF